MSRGKLQRVVQRVENFKALSGLSLALSMTRTEKVLAKAESMSGRKLYTALCSFCPGRAAQLLAGQSSISESTSSETVLAFD